MIDENTPHKLAEIIRDTWPNLYYLKEDNKIDSINTSKSNSTERVVRCPG
jgi:hypothetical protein